MHTVDLCRHRVKVKIIGARSWFIPFGFTVLASVYSFGLGLKIFIFSIVI